MADSPTERRNRSALRPNDRGRTPDERRHPGSPQGARQGPRMPGSRMFWVIVLVALTLNYVLVAVFASGKERSVTVPYSPAFLQQVDKGNVKRVSTQGATVTGEFKNPIRYPNDKAPEAKNFKTEIPSWIVYSSGSDLTKRLTEHNVELSAEPLNQGNGFFTNLILGFGPVILLVFLFI